MGVAGDAVHPRRFLAVQTTRVFRVTFSMRMMSACSREEWLRPRCVYDQSYSSTGGSALQEHSRRALPPSLTAKV